MSSNDYHFVDRWRVQGTINEVADLLEDALSLPRRRAGGRDNLHTVPDPPNASLSVRALGLNRS
jgi:hypothetical protein